MSENNKKIIGSEIEYYLPQRFPFLLLDKIESYELGQWAKGSKNISFCESVLLNDDADQWPEAYVVESLGQLAIALFNLKHIGKKPPQILLGSVSGVTFHSQFPIGCKIDLYVSVDVYVEGDSFVISGYADVNGERKLTMDSLTAKILIQSE